MPLILASGSGIRRAMLDHVGLDFEVRPAHINEGAVKAAHAGSVGELTCRLAEEKALAVSRLAPGSSVIGSDSIAMCDGRMLDKPRSRQEAAEHLRLFSSKSLILNSSVALARDGKQLWSAMDEAELKVRKLSDAFIESYLEMEWPAVSHCVGVFRLEGPGPLLFEKISGSHFTILGMPLLPLLKALRERQILAS